MSASLPQLGLVADARAPQPVTWLLREMHWWCRVCALEPGAPAAAAWLFLSPRARGIDRVTGGTTPFAVWAADPVELGLAAALRPAAIVTADVDVARASLADADVARASLAGTVLSLAEPRGALWRARPVPPFVRARMRKRQGLPERWVADLRQQPPGERCADAETALRAAAALVVTGEALLTALAWGAPCVSDEASARHIGAQDDVDVVVGPPADLPGLAAELAGDPRRAARLGRAGRRRAERAGAEPGVAARLARRLALHLNAAASPRGILEMQLQELGAPAHARVRQRVEERIHHMVRAHTDERTSN